MTITELAKEVDEAAEDYCVGGIQEFRRAMGRNRGGCEITKEWKINQGDRDARVDVVIETGAGPIFCEIKVASGVRAAARKAVGQLLEYAHWPNENRSRKWWVVSKETPIAKDRAYLPRLRSLYQLPVFYRQISIDTGDLGPET